MLSGNVCYDVGVSTANLQLLHKQGTVTVLRFCSVNIELVLSNTAIFKF